VSRQADLSVVIPTYGREHVLIETVEHLLNLSHPAAEILLVDQTVEHQPETTQALSRWSNEGRIRWLRLTEPSVTCAMNVGLASATKRYVAFVDDDVVPEADLFLRHVSAHSTAGNILVVGRVVQQWEKGVAEDALGPESFAHQSVVKRTSFIGCNFSVDREFAVRIGGFDENFVRVAYRYEAEFAKRWLDAGGVIVHEPLASLTHLKCASGGTRAFGEHLTTAKPDHSVGAYYFALRTGALREVILRLVRSVMTRFHVCAPWRIPVTLVAELRGLWWAIRLRVAGPRLMSSPRTRLSSVESLRVENRD